MPQETAAIYSPTANWRLVNYPSASGGAWKYATVAISDATFTFTGTSVAWVAPKSNNRGKAAVFIDNTQVATVDLYSPTLQVRQLVYSRGGLSVGTHTITVRVLGQKQAASSNTIVDVDAFIVMRNL